MIGTTRASCRTTAARLRGRTGSVWGASRSRQIGHRQAFSPTSGVLGSDRRRNGVSRDRWLPLATALLALAALYMLAFTRPGKRAVRRLARWLDSRVEGFSEPDSRRYAHFVAPALGQLYRRVADDLVAEPAASGRDRHTARETTVLDLGCGPGDLTAILAARLPGARVIGLDLSPSMVELARRHGRAHGRLRFEIGDVARLPFEAGSIDLVVSTLSLHHWPEPAAVFSEMRRVLRPGGAALVYDLRLLTVEADALPEIARRAGLAEGELRRERLSGGLLAGLFVRYRVDLRPAATGGR